MGGFQSASPVKSRLEGSRLREALAENGKTTPSLELSFLTLGFERHGILELDGRPQSSSVNRDASEGIAWSEGFLGKMDSA